jgi:hypothetical protein
VELTADDEAACGRARAKRQAVAAKLFKLSHPRAVDLLALVDLGRHVVEGKWRREGAALAAVVEDNTGPRKHTLKLPVVPNGSYEVRTALSRHNAHTYLYLPVLGRTCTVAADSSISIDGIDGYPANHAKNPTTTRIRYSASHDRPGIPVTVRALLGSRGANVRVTITIDGDEHVNWTGPVTTFPQEKGALAGALAVRVTIPDHVTAGRAAYHRLWIEMLSGTLGKGR